MNLFEHSKDCSPLTPCQACELVMWLRSKLQGADFDELIERARSLNPAAPKRVYRRRKNAEAQATNEQSAP